MINFSFLIPTRNRPDLVGRLFQSIVDTTACLDNVEIVLCCDDDDLVSQQISDERLILKRVVIPNGATMGALNKACFEASSGRYVMLLNDDVILRTKNWGRIVSDVFASFKDDIALVHVNDLLFREKLCTFPILSRKACLEIGICPSEYRRYRIDDHIYDTYNMLAYLGHKRIVYLPDVVFEHDNYAHGGKTEGQHFKSQDNKVYSPNQEIIDFDETIFNGKMDERKGNALKLAGLIEQLLYHEKQASYRGLLSGIRDPYSYRRGDFVKTISSTEKDILKPPTVTVAVVSSDIYKPHPAKCLSLLKEHTSNFDLLILDNNNGKDFNHPREMNKVLRSVESDFLVLMDDDVFVEPGWLEGLLKCVDAETGMVSPMHKDGKGELSYSGVYLMGNGRGTHVHHLDTIVEPRVTQAACSACILIDLKKCGHLRLNTVYKKYFLDLDYSLQVWEAGYKVVVAPESIVTHLGGATMSWSSEISNMLVNRDEGIFIDVWIKSGRLAGLASGIWSRFPLLKFITEIPQTLESFCLNADNMELGQFKGEVDNLVKNIQPLTLFHAQLITALDQCQARFASRGETIKEQYCKEALNNFRTGGITPLLPEESTALRALAIKLVTQIKSNRLLYRFVLAIITTLKRGFDRYLASSSPLRRFTDKPVLKMAVMYQKLVAASLSPAAPEGASLGNSAHDMQRDVPQGGSLYICTLSDQKIKKHLEELGEKAKQVILLIPASRAKAWQNSPAIVYKDAFEKDSDIVGATGVSSNLVSELKARNFDLVIIAYDEPINWENTKLENFVSSFAGHFMIIFPNGNKRLYTRYDDANRILYNKAYLGNMFRFIPRPKGEKILDVGCSDGLVCDLLLNEGAESVVGIDIMESVGENYKDERITYHRMDASSLLFDDRSFDLTFSIATLEHCKDPLKVLNEMKRVTKRGGYCYVQAGPLYHSPFGHHMFGYFDNYPWIHLRLTKDEIIEYCRLKGIDKKIEKSTGQDVRSYVYGMINDAHVNGMTLNGYGLEKFMASKEIEVLHFSKSYEGENLLNEEILHETQHIPREDLIGHGFELVFRVKG